MEKNPHNSCTKRAFLELLMGTIKIKEGSEELIEETAERISEIELSRRKLLKYGLYGAGGIIASALGLAGYLEVRKKMTLPTIKTNEYLQVDNFKVYNFCTYFDVGFLPENLKSSMKKEGVSFPPFSLSVYFIDDGLLKNVSSKHATPYNVKDYVEKIKKNPNERDDRIRADASTGVLSVIIMYSKYKERFLDSTSNEFPIDLKPELTTIYNRLFEKFQEKSNPFNSFKTPPEYDPFISLIAKNF